MKVVDRDELKDVELEVFNADEKAEILQGLLLDVEESYSHCPRALKFSKLWDVEQISQKHRHAAGRSQRAGNLDSRSDGSAISVSPAPVSCAASIRRDDFGARSHGGVSPADRPAQS